MSEKARKLLFYEIGKGLLALEAQAEFERVQRLVNTLEKKASFSIKITVYPSDFNDVELNQRFGKVNGEIIPARVSRVTEKFTTELKDGVAVCDGKNIADVLQETLFPEEKVQDKLLKMGGKNG